jgi:hypothetical protein
VSAVWPFLLPSLVAGALLLFGTLWVNRGDRANQKETILLSLFGEVQEERTWLHTMSVENRARIVSLERERDLDKMWIASLVNHIVAQLPPPPPARPTLDV